MGDDIRLEAALDEKPEATVRRLLGAMSFAHRLERSPYADLLSPAQWSAGAKHFEHECLGMLGMPRGGAVVRTSSVRPIVRACVYSCNRCGAAVRVASAPVGATL